ncbi:hypothetical protein QTG54_003937 [Skeletonema marinoi]|uniref:Uncharacterized protein n=1 Tax=Skeletonema marinoi TaxID=267567 RepID=A0AAD8YHB7_9STRA|nr:hypothetical protein QTG54_003937 [Skeletonema marinoi]
MESKLVPYVHYVAENDDDLLSQLEWAKENDDKCKWISEQATAYIQNLWSSDQEPFDLIVIKHMMGKMYHYHEVMLSKALTVCQSGSQSDKSKSVEKTKEATAIASEWVSAVKRSGMLAFTSLATKSRKIAGSVT